MKNVITISREYGSGGKAIGKMVAERLGYRFYDAEIIEEIARDEYDHAHAIKRILDRHRHHDVDEETKALWDEAARAFEEEDYD